ncbi:MAG: amidohydrolase [Candidatus Glassbacteria bacterium]|nr:amidohydrolase [Candidatus Glassbacteria bacterium]
MFRILYLALMLTVATPPPAAARQSPVSPAPDNAERELGDNGFSAGFGATNHSWSLDWFDSHLHLAWSHFPNVLRGQQIQEVMDHWFERVGVYHCGRAILLDPYPETMEWARDDPRVHLFWWMNWDEGGKLDEVRRRVSEGLIQGLKLHTADFRRQQDESFEVMGSPEWREIYAWCQANGLPILLHLNEHWGDQHYAYGRGAKEFWARASYSNGELLNYFLTELAAEYPDLKWTLAHMNFMGVDSLSAIMDRHPNIYVETSIGMFLREYDHLTPEEIAPYREFCIKYADRVMFGTDGFAYQPLESRFPGHVRNWWLPHHIFITQLGLPRETLDKITHGTCEAMLGKYLKQPDTGGR